MAVDHYFKRALGTEPKAKRPYTRRSKPQAAVPEPVEQKVNFCPNCGCNIHNVAMGMVLAKTL